MYQSTVATSNKTGYEIESDQWPMKPKKSQINSLFKVSWSHSWILSWSKPKSSWSYAAINFGKQIVGSVY